MFKSSWSMCSSSCVCLLFWMCSYIYIFLSVRKLFVFFTHGFWKLYGCKCDLMVCFHKQDSSNTIEHLSAKNLNLSLYTLRSSQTCCLSIVNLNVLAKLNMPVAIITGMFSCVWDVQAAKRRERTMAVSSWACHRVRLDWHMLGQITGAGVDGGSPSDSQPSATQELPKTGSDLG